MLNICPREYIVYIDTHSVPGFVQGYPAVGGLDKQIFQRVISNIPKTAAKTITERCMFTKFPMSAWYHVRQQNGRYAANGQFCYHLVPMVNLWVPREKKMPNAFVNSKGSG